MVTLNPFRDCLDPLGSQVTAMRHLYRRAEWPMGPLGPSLGAVWGRKIQKEADRLQADHPSATVVPTLGSPYPSMMMLALRCRGRVEGLGILMDPSAQLVEEFTPRLARLMRLGFTCVDPAADSLPVEGPASLAVLAAAAFSSRFREQLTAGALPVIGLPGISWKDDGGDTRRLVLLSEGGKTRLAPWHHATGRAIWVPQVQELWTSKGKAQHITITTRGAGNILRVPGANT